jgi:signal peptidase I
LSTFDEHAPRLPQSSMRGTADAEAMALRGSAATRTEPESARTGTRDRAEQGKSLVWEVAQTILLTIAIFLAVRLVVQNFRVEGASMDPTLRSGQFLLINKIGYVRADGTPLESVVAPRNGSELHYLFGGPQRGEIIVFRAPGQSDKDYIKRVIGLPGETIQIKDGRIFINGTELDEPYIRYHARYDLDSKKIPSDSFFVLGDNRPNSSDSHLGWFVPAESIIGRAWLSYWPYDVVGVVESASYANLKF